MALTSAATNITNSATIVGGVGKVLGDAVIAFNKVNVISPLIASKTGVVGSITVEWADWKVASYSDVAQTNEFAEATVQQIDTTARTATLTEHVLQIDIADLAEQGYGAGGSLGGNAGAVIGNAISARLDNDLAALFAPGNFTNDVAGAGATLKHTHIFEALRFLHANQAPAPLNLVLGTQQTWGELGLRAIITGSATGLTGAVNIFGSNQMGTDLAVNGFVTKFAGFDVYSTPEIVEDGSNDEAGCAFSRNAMGMAIPAKGLINIETQRDASKRITEYVGVGTWGEAIIKELYGVSVTSDVNY
jgi:hypothetical protein